jgi:hypothetical protein
VVTEVVGSVEGVVVAWAVAVVTVHRLVPVFAVYVLQMPVEIGGPAELLAAVLFEANETGGCRCARCGNA